LALLEDSFVDYAVDSLLSAYVFQVPVFFFFEFFFIYPQMFAVGPGLDFLSGSFFLYFRFFDIFFYNFYNIFSFSFFFFDFDFLILFDSFFFFYFFKIFCFLIF
jgi:hypothetical protein